MWEVLVIDATGRYHAFTYAVNSAAAARKLFWRNAGGRKNGVKILSIEEYQPLHPSELKSIKPLTDVDNCGSEV